MIIFTTFRTLTVPVHQAIDSWHRVFPDAQILVFGNAALLRDWCGYRQVKRRKGLPLVSDMFEKVEMMDDPGPRLFINSDCIVTSSMKKACDFLVQVKKQWLATGQRSEISEEEDCANAGSLQWEEAIRAKYPEPKMLPPCGADWFLFSRSAMRESKMPPFVIARTCYDNWLIYDALQRGLWVVNCTGSVTVYHQTHPEQEVRRSDDAKENYRLCKKSYPKWNDWSGWIKHANTTLVELQEKIVL